MYVALLETREMEIAAEVEVVPSVEIGNKTTTKIKPHKTVQSGTPGGLFQPTAGANPRSRRWETGRMTVQTDAGERELSKAESERGCATTPRSANTEAATPPAIKRRVAHVGGKR